MIKLSTNLICLIAKGITQLIFFTFFSRKGSQKITWYCFLGNWTKDITTGEKTCSLLSYIIWIYISRIYLHHVTKIFLSLQLLRKVLSSKLWHLFELPQKLRLYLLLQTKCYFLSNWRNLTIVFLMMYLFFFLIIIIWISTLSSTWISNNHCNLGTINLCKKRTEYLMETVLTKKEEISFSWS